MSLNYKGVKGPTHPSRFDDLLIANSEPPIWKYEAQSVSWILLFLFSDRTGECLYWGDICHCETRVQAISLILNPISLPIWDESNDGKAQQG